MMSTEPFDRPKGPPFERPQGPPFERPQGPNPQGKPIEAPVGRPHDKPPVFQRWSGWYWLVFLVMVAQVLLYLFITRSFS